MELGRSLGITISFSNPGLPVVAEMDDKEFLNLAYSLSEAKPSISGQAMHVEVSWEYFDARPSKSSIYDRFFFSLFCGRPPGHLGTIGGILILD